MLDSIRVISDGLSAINLHLADMLPSAEGYDTLELQRNEVHNRLSFLSRKFFGENTDRFIENEHELAVANENMTEALERLENMRNVLDNVKRYISVIDAFIEAVFPGNL